MNIDKPNLFLTTKGNLHFLGGITGGLASAVGGAVGGLISNGYSSTAGSVVDKVGDLMNNPICDEFAEFDVYKAD